MSQADNASTTTTFLLLRALKSERPDILNNDSPAAQAFNVALRAVASRDGYSSQWFGWQHPPSPTTESKTCPERLIWAINWQDTWPDQALALPQELEKVVGDLALYFEVPEILAPGHCIAAEVGTSLILVVQWSQGDAQKVLDRTNRKLELSVRKQSAGDTGAVSPQRDEAATPDLVAGGRVVPPQVEVEDWKFAQVMVRSLSQQEAPAEAHTFTRVHDCSGATVTVSLTRTRWCTRIRGDLHDLIKARRVD